jgi:F-type H+-transporting ATPase subunit b
MRSFPRSTFAATFRRLSVITVALALAATPVLAQEEAPNSTDLLSLRGGLMVWTLAIFLVLMFILSRFAFRPLTAAVQAREKALADALESARRDREQANALLEEQRRQLEAGRTEAQRIIAEGRSTAEKLRGDMLEQTRAQQQELLDRARREIESEKTRAIADLRREAVDLALAGASKVIERNLDDAQNRKLIESFLSSVGASGAAVTR